MKKFLLTFVVLMILTCGVGLNEATSSTPLNLDNDCPDIFIPKCKIFSFSFSWFILFIGVDMDEALPHYKVY